MVTLTALALVHSAAPAEALQEGSVAGVVTTAGGSPVANATVVLLGEHGNYRQTLTAVDGHYSTGAWPDTYRVGVMPPRGSSEGFAGKGVVVGDGATATVDVSLAPTRGSARLSGNGSYADHSPNAGVEVAVYEHHLLSGVGRGNQAWTEEDGDWDVGVLPDGIYDVVYVVNVSEGSPGKRARWTVGHETIFLEAGKDLTLADTLEGRKPEGMVEVTATAAEGWPARAGAYLLIPGGESESSWTDASQPARLFAPTGTYTLEISPYEQELMDVAATRSVSVTDGHVTHVEVALPALALPAGIAAQREQQELAWLNQQRSRWGLPGALSSVPLWSRACAAHDVYGALNDILEHPESQGRLGYSPGGHWAGTHSILARSGERWSADDNPWMDAPIHLNQMFTPWLEKVGIDDTGGYQCMTTWPGMSRGFEQAGKVWTFPGDGTTGFPPVEFASEQPETPNRALGLPDLTGRQLFVYEAGTSGASESPIDVLSASLAAPSGPVEVRWLDGQGGLGGYLTGAILIPVKPLEPFTTYTASVTLAAVQVADGTVVPQKTHTWSFKTGRDNPHGDWQEEEPRAGRNKLIVHRVLRLSYRNHAVLVQGRHFKQGEVVLRRKLSRAVLARVQANRGGRFTARIPWPRRMRLALEALQGGRATLAVYRPRARSG